MSRKGKTIFKPLTGEKLNEFMEQLGKAAAIHIHRDYFPLADDEKKRLMEHLQNNFRHHFDGTLDLRWDGDYMELVRGFGQTAWNGLSGYHPTEGWIRKLQPHIDSPGAPLWKIKEAKQAWLARS